MFKYILPILLIGQAHATLIISDVDDTIKITNSGSIVDATWSGLFKDKVFPGMPELYRAWGNTENKIHFVTGAPSVIRGKIRSLLAHHKVPYESLTTRGNILEGNYSYKMKAISRIMKASPEEQVVLIGDDVSQDHNVFAAIAKKFPNRVAASYIRLVKNRTLPEGLIPYVSAYDVVTTEVESARLNLIDYGVVTTAVMTGPKERLMPSFAWCPTEMEGTLLPTESSRYVGAQQVEDRIEEICRDSRSDSENLH